MKNPSDHGNYGAVFFSFWGLFAVNEEPMSIKKNVHIALVKGDFEFPSLPPL